MWGHGISSSPEGSGKRFLLSLFLLVGPLCAVLPNATAVILVAPIIIRVARALEVDFTGPMIITAIISNSAGLLTLVGDPATFLVGSSIGMSFTQYLQKVSLGGLLSLLALVPLLPFLMKDLWQQERSLPADLKPEPLKRPYLCLSALLILALMVVLFIAGEYLPTKIVPPAVAIVAASLGLLLVYEAQVEPVTKVIQDVDWRTLLFLICLFCLVEAFAKTGILQGMSHYLYAWFGTELILISLFILAFVGRFFQPAGQYSRRRHYAADGEGLPGHRPIRAGDGAGGEVCGVADGGAARFRGHDVCRHPGRERHPHRRLGQCGGLRYLRLSRQTGIIRDFPAVRGSPDHLPVNCLCPVCPGAYLFYQSLILCFTG